MLFRREWKRNLKSLLTWSAIMAGLILLLLSMYPQIAADQQAVNEMLEVYPDSLKRAFGMDVIHFGTLIGYYAIEVYMMITLVGSVYASLLASGILVKEEGDKTIEFLLSKPVTRTQIVIKKLLLVGINLLVFHVIMFLATWIGFSFSEDKVDLKSFALLLGAALLLHVTFASFSFLLSAVMRKSRSIVSSALGIVFISYAFHIAAGISEQAKILKHISLFHYVDASQLLELGHIRAVYALVMVCFIVISIGLAWAYYHRKDMMV